jgi:hypothetical protein
MLHVHKVLSLKIDLLFGLCLFFTFTIKKSIAKMYEHTYFVEMYIQKNVYLLTIKNIFFKWRKRMHPGRRTVLCNLETIDCIPQLPYV